MPRETHSTTHLPFLNSKGFCATKLNRLALKMAESGDQRGLRDSSDLMGRCLVSLVFSSLTQLVLYTVAKFFPSSSLLALLYFSVMALLGLAGVGRCSKTLLGVRASAPAFVFFNIIFIWGVYIGVVRQVISPLMDFILNSELLMLMIGLSSMLSTDPGFVTKDSSHHLNIPLECPVSVVEPPSKELVPSTSDLPYDFAAEDNSFPLQRVRYCRLCKSYVKGFDHHCPAFGNCIGQKNHILFVILLVGFISTEASYVACSSQFTTKIQILDKTEGLTSLSRTLAISTMLFSLLQVLWQDHAGECL